MLNVKNLENSIKAARFESTTNSTNWGSLSLIQPKAQHEIDENISNIIEFTPYLSKISKSKLQALN